MPETNIGELMKLIAGKEQTPEQIQRLEAIAHRMGIDRHDPMLAVIAAMDVYHGVFSRLPAEVAKLNKESAERSAASAAVQAQAEVNKAVAALVPSVEQAVKDAARGAVRRLQLGKSMYTLWLGVCALGIAFAFGWLAGAHVFAAWQDKSVSTEYLWHETSWGIGMGFASTVLILLGAGDLEFRGKPAWQWMMFGLGVFGMIVLGGSLFGYIRGAN